MLRSTRGTSTSSSALTSMMTKLLFSKGSKHKPPSSSLTISQPFITGSSLTYTSRYPLSPQSQITYHCPLCHIPTITNFGSLISRNPEPALTPISQPWIGKPLCSSSSKTSKTSGLHLPSSSCTRQMLCPGGAGPLSPKKIIVSPETYNGSPQKFHEWWSKVKVWINTAHATTTNQQKAAAVYSCLEGPCVGHFTQVYLNEGMANNMWLTWCNRPVFKSIGHYSSTPECQTTCSAVCFWFNQGTMDLCFLSVSLPTRLPRCS